jgi:hypothetical protein
VMRLATEEQPLRFTPIEARGADRERKGHSPFRVVFSYAFVFRPPAFQKGEYLLFASGSSAYKANTTSPTHWSRSR